MNETFVASAPGKLVLLGEYVVLEGAPALVAAMDRRAEARFVPHAEPFWSICAPTLGAQGQYHLQPDKTLAPRGEPVLALRFAEAVLRHTLAQPRAKLPFGALTLETHQFFADGQKLGLGSSAAISCACWQVLRAASLPGDDAQAAPMTDRRRQGPLATLQELHHTVQGGVGSGIDIAASLWGGIIRFQRDAQSPTPQVARMQALQNMVIVPVFSGHAAATAPLLKAFARLKAERPNVYWQQCETLAVLANAGAEFWALGHVSALLTVVDQVHEALRQLGREIGAAIVTPEHDAIAKIARRAGASYKPSGAGGGDLGIAVCPTRQVAGRVTAKLRAQGMVPVPMALGAHGVSVERIEA